MVRTLSRSLLVLAALGLSFPAASQGKIGTIERGSYVCELPGDAAGRVGIEQPDQNFRIINASRYQVEEGSGTYLRRGNRLTMTSGPRSGDSYEVISPTFLRKIEDGEPGRLRCIRTGT